MKSTESDNTKTDLLATLDHNLIDTYLFAAFVKELFVSLRGHYCFGKDKEDYNAISTFLVFTADKKESLSNSEYRKASREVSDIAIGRYEKTQKRGYSMKI